MVNGNHMSSSPAFLYTQLHGGRREREVGAAGLVLVLVVAGVQQKISTQPNQVYLTVLCAVM